MDIRRTEARSILTPVTGFLREAGFTHSLTPARNCTYGCTYCYVPTMHVFGGLKPEDWKRWGQFTTFKANAAELLRGRDLEKFIIYCSPLVDPYQPAEGLEGLMPAILEELALRPPKIFVLQTRSPRVLRDVAFLRRLAAVTTVRISFSITTNRADVEKRYEPRCESNEERLAAIETLNREGIETYATLAPLLPCDPEELVRRAVQSSGRSLIGDPLHIRQLKPSGATTRDAAWRIAEKFGELEWFQPEFQKRVVDAIRRAAHTYHYGFATGPKGFSCLTR